MYNVVPGITQSPPTIIWYTNVEKFKDDSYLVISVSNLLICIDGVTARLGENCKFFRLRREK